MLSLSPRFHAPLSLALRATGHSESPFYCYSSPKPNITGVCEDRIEKLLLCENREFLMTAVVMSSTNHATVIAKTHFLARTPKRRNNPLHDDTRVAGNTLEDLLATASRLGKLRCTYWPELSSLLSDGSSDSRSLHLSLGVDNLRYAVSAALSNP